MLPSDKRKPYVIMSEMNRNTLVLFIMNIELPSELVPACEVDIVFVESMPVDN